MVHDDHDLVVDGFSRDRVHKRLGERLRARTRTAALFISKPSFGISESPIPGRSGAITVNLSDSRGMIGLHIRDVCV
jgi:hypothetical protein